MIKKSSNATMLTISINQDVITKPEENPPFHNPFCFVYEKRASSNIDNEIIPAAKYSTLHKKKMPLPVRQ